jgi:hypothetical protein
MRVLLILLLCLVVSLGFGQQINAPDPKEFTINTLAQNASGFSLSGFGINDVLLCAIGLPTAPNGTTFYLTTTTGLTPATGYTMTGNKTRLAFTGTQTNINNALATLKINTNTTTGNIQISVSATVNPTGFFYNPTNGHFYRPISTGATYTNARAAALNNTFKGQTGYLVTITSADEDAFIFNNVPQGNIWFALTDEVTEGRWVIDAGPERGTVIKTANGQTAGNIPGQYNNWAGGEPNNAGNEDYAVTKWNGSQWNDLPNNFVNPYVIEFGTWTNPDDQTFTDFYNNSTIYSNGPNTNLRAFFTFNFAGNIDETKFSGALFKRNDSNSVWTGNTFKALNGLGRITLSEQLDTAKVFNVQQLRRYKQHKFQFQNYDSVQLKTLYNSIVTVSDVYLAFKELADAGGIFGGGSGTQFAYGIQFKNADVNDDGYFNEADCFSLLQHLTGTKDLIGNYTLDNTMKIILDTTYDMISKSNWQQFPSYLGKEYNFNLSDGVINYTYNLAVSWKGDVNLSHSTQQTPNSVAGTSITSMNINSMSTSTTNQINAYIITEIVNDSVYAYITIDPLQQELVGTQFKLNYDNTILQFNNISYKTKGSPTNYGTDKGDYVNFGSLITDGGVLDNTTEYKISFKPQTKLNNVLGLISIAFTDAVNKSGNSLKVIMK